MVAALKENPKVEMISGDLDYQMEQPGYEEGYFFKPVVLEGIDVKSKAFQEKYFGPVFSLYRVNSLQEAIEYANNSNYGHCATVFSEKPLYCKTMAL